MCNGVNKIYVRQCAASFLSISEMALASCLTGFLEYLR